MQLVDSTPPPQQPTSPRYRTTSDQIAYRSRQFEGLRSAPKKVDSLSEISYCSSPDSAVVTASESLGSSESIDTKVEDSPKRNVFPKRRNNRRYRRWCQLKQGSTDSCFSQDSTESSSTDGGNNRVNKNTVPTAVVRNTLECPLIFPPGCHPVEWNGVPVVPAPQFLPFYNPFIPPMLPWQLQQQMQHLWMPHRPVPLPRPAPQATGLGSVTVDLTGHNVAYSVERLPPVNRSRQSPASLSGSSSPSDSDQETNQTVLPQTAHSPCLAPFLSMLPPPPPPSVYIPAPLRLPRAFDHVKSLKTCAVPYHEFNNYVNSTPPHRQWRQLGAPTKDGYRFTVMSYNILNTAYATTAQYPYCPTWALDWEYRRRGIIEELRRYEPTIICLQEVDIDQYETVFVPELTKAGYEGMYLCKTRSRTMTVDNARKVDGCAMFWHKEKVTKVTQFQHEFAHSAPNVTDRPPEPMLNRVMPRDNVAIGVIFETTGSAENGGGRRFCVTTGHIHWDPEQSDVKLVQSIIWTAELWSYLEKYCSEGTKPTPGAASRMPVVFCGDFNSLPNSGVVEFLSKGAVPKSHVEFLNLGFAYRFEDWKILEKWASEGDILRHRFNFDRAYKNGDADGMKVTNLTYDFKGMIDYIFYTRQHFRLLGSLDQIPESWFLGERVLGCPHIHVPSDHFPLLVELDLLAQPIRSGGLAISDPLGDSPQENSHPPSASASATNSPKPKGANRQKQNASGSKR